MSKKQQVEIDGREITLSNAKKCITGLRIHQGIGRSVLRRDVVGHPSAPRSRPDTTFDLDEFHARASDGRSSTQTLAARVLQSTRIAHERAHIRTTPANFRQNDECGLGPGLRTSETRSTAGKLDEGWRGRPGRRLVAHERVGWRSHARPSLGSCGLSDVASALRRLGRRAWIARVRPSPAAPSGSRWHVT
jgi:hypothetical protein